MLDSLSVHLRMTGHTGAQLGLARPHRHPYSQSTIYGAGDRVSVVRV